MALEKFPNICRMMSSVGDEANLLQFEMDVNSKTGSLYIIRKQCTLFSEEDEGIQARAEKAVDTLN